MNTKFCIYDMYLNLSLTVHKRFTQFILSIFCPHFIRINILYIKSVYTITIRYMITNLNLNLKSKLYIYIYIYVIYLIVIVYSVYTSSVYKINSFNTCFIYLFFIYNDGIIILYAFGW